MEAALLVFMREGYSRSSVARITQEAGVSQGTFYSYFASHRELLAELLPREGERIQAVLAELPHADSFFQQERERFAAVLHYVRDRPYILRLLVEAEVGDPAGFRRYMLHAEQRYLVAYKEGAARGELRPLAPRQVRVIAEMIVGCRAQIALHLETLSAPGSETRLKHERWTLDAVEKFLTHGLSAAVSPTLGVPRRRPSATSARSLKDSIFEAAAREIGERGFAATSIQGIIGRSNVALGTFYAYFEGRDQFLGALLRYARRLVLARIRQAVEDVENVVDAEARSLGAFFDLLVEQPWLAKLPAEASVWAPDAYRHHFGVISRSYRKYLRAIARRGQLSEYKSEELVVLGAIFTSARHYLASRFIHRSDGAPKWVVRTYADIVAIGLGQRRQ